MSGFEGAYDTILQGVSQQLPKLRLPGQVTAQDNMLSDIVTNVRRRPGMAFKFGVDLPGEVYTTVRSWATDIREQAVHVFIGTRSGRMCVIRADTGVMVALVVDPYFQSPDPSTIRAATIGNEFYVLNTAKQPTLGAASEFAQPPERTGFFYIRSGAFSKKYQLTITTPLGTRDIVYTTPNATEEGAADKSTPDGIAAGLVAAAISSGATDALKLGIVGSGAYMYVEYQGATGSVPLAVTSPSGSSYIQCSNVSKVRVEADLPASLPVNAQGMVMAVGDQGPVRYYKFNFQGMEWRESGSYGSPRTLVNMPVVLTMGTDGNWGFSKPPFEGRLAGDDETNPLPDFCLTRRPSGLGAFQNRLVILCGSQVYMSASGKPRRFLRSTVTSLLDSDPIAVASSNASSSDYQYAVQFQKDLLLFASKYQALIPSSGQAVTPRTATVLQTSAYSVDISCEPIPVGRTLLFPAPRSADYFGFMEMVSSQYTDSQYVANDATAHVPKYMGGRCRFGAASAVSSMVLFGTSRDPRSLVVYEYSWDGDTKVQQSWHTWRFAYPVATAYFANSVINVVFMNGTNMIGCTMDPRLGAISFDSTRRPYLDMHVEVNVVNNKCTIPSWILNFDAGAASKLSLAVATGPLAGEEVGVESVSGNVLTTVPSFPSGRIYMGFKYSSLFSPTPPVIKDYNGIPIESTKHTILRFGVMTQNSSEFKVLVTDNTSDDIESLDQATLRFSSRELELGQARVGKSSRAIIPARTEAGSTSLVIHTDGTGELNFTGLDYVGRYNTRIRRR